ncbi:hypothetical protein HQ585_01810 [candidate division KSB1 bacterium]|nr:hypothetical protein [candidate division KSB1 bacterium]
MRHLIVHIGLALHLMLSSTGFSEEPTHAIPQTGSHRSFAMGGAYLAFDTGINALYGNPAGLAKSSQAEIIIGHYWQVYKTMQYEDAYYTTQYSDVSISYKPVQRINYVGVSFLKASRDSIYCFGGGIGYSSFYTWHTTRHERRIYDDGSQTRIERDSYGNYSLIHLGIGFSIGNKSEIGITANIPFLNRTTNVTHYIDIYEPFSTYSNTINRKEANPFLRIGATIQLTSQISLGILWNQSYWYKYDFQKTVLPSALNFGLAVKPVKNCLVAIDLESRPWSKVKIYDGYIGNAQSGTAWHFGVEYGKRLKTRAGYTWDILPILDAEEQPVDLQSISLGFGYRIGTVQIDLGTRYRFSTHKTNSPLWWRNTDITYDYLFRDLVIQSGIKFIH